MLVANPFALRILHTLVATHARSAATVQPLKSGPSANATHTHLVKRSWAASCDDDVAPQGVAVGQT
jgi:hypothetical protein